MGFAKFMASVAGRVLRIVAGIALLLVGLLVMNGIVGYVVAIVGLVPILAGVFDFCIFAPLLGAPLGGKAIREA